MLPKSGPLAPGALCFSSNLTSYFNQYISSLASHREVYIHNHEEMKPQRQTQIRLDLGLNFLAFKGMVLLNF